MTRKKIFSLAAALLLGVLCIAAPKKNHYTNPILFSDYSDPDVIRVGDDYWMTSSSFTCFPGLQILHSYDLLNWEIVSSALIDLGDDPAFDAPSHGNGVWAPCIRYNEGVYWIFWGDPDRGIYQVHTTDPRSSWSKPTLVLEGKGLIDPSPLWDEDGRVYLVHGWAGSRAGFKSVLSVCEMNRNCTGVISNQVMVFDGKSNGNDTIEGPKFYKRDGWYYIFAPSGGVKEGWQLVLKSRNVYGPYEWRKVLHQGSTDIHGPHQGGWVTDYKGSDWFLHFEDRYAWGRVCHLQPMEWKKDGWCVIGLDPDKDGVGEPVLEYKKPAVKKELASKVLTEVSALETVTGFRGVDIPLNWQWEANPKFHWFMTCPSKGCLRLNCIKQDEGWNNLRDTPNILAEKIVGPRTVFETKLVYTPSYESERVGVAVIGRDYATLELTNAGSEGVFLRRLDCYNAKEGAKEEVNCSLKYSDDKQITLYVRLEVRDQAICTFSYSRDGKDWDEIGSDFKAREGDWIGAKIGLFAISDIKKNDGGYVEIY